MLRWFLPLLVAVLAPGLPSIGQSLIAQGCGGNATLMGKALVQYPDKMYPAARVRVYLFTLEQSARIRSLDQRAYERAHEPGGDAKGASRATFELLRDLSHLIPRLPHVAAVKTDRRGCYKFEMVEAGKRYHLVAWAEWEDGYYFAAGVTPLLKAGQRLRFDLRDDAPWERRFRCD